MVASEPASRRSLTETFAGLGVPTSIAMSLASLASGSSCVASVGSSHVCAARSVKNITSMAAASAAAISCTKSFSTTTVLPSVAVPYDGSSVVSWVIARRWSATGPAATTAGGSAISSSVYESPAWLPLSTSPANCFARANAVWSLAWYSIDSDASSTSTR